MQAQDLILKFVVAAGKIEGEKCPNVAVSIQSDPDFLPREIGSPNNLQSISVRERDDMQRIQMPDKRWMIT